MTGAHPEKTPFPVLRKAVASAGVRLAALMLIFAAGCAGTRREQAEISGLSDLRRIAVKRDLDGDTAQRLSELARRSVRDEKRHGLSDMAGFVMHAPAEAGGETARRMLWDGASLCAAMFSADPDREIRDLCRGELECRTAQLVAEREFLDRIIWKTPEQTRREKELRSESLQLFGPVPEEAISGVELAFPPETEGDDPPGGADALKALKLAGALLLIPDEIKRLKLADPAFSAQGIVLEVVRMAAEKALAIDESQLREAEKRWRLDPTEENLFRWRRWFYIRELDASRMPEKRGSEEDRRFVESMVLLRDNL